MQTICLGSLFSLQQQMEKSKRGCMITWDHEWIMMHQEIRTLRWHTVQMDQGDILFKLEQIKHHSDSRDLNFGNVDDSSVVSM